MTVGWQWNVSCDEAVGLLRQRLSQAGLASIASFDLRSAGIPSLDCPCPHHGTADCDCQMVVLLVFGLSKSPATLVAHGYEGRTLFSLEQASGTSGSPDLAAQLRTMLLAPAVR